MKRITAVYSTSIGKKFIAAVTGLILFGFLVGHMAGNLKVFTGVNSAGEHHIDEYAHALRVFGEPFLPEMLGLWMARSVLLFSLILHVIVVIQLALQSAEARPVGYARSRKRVASLPAQWMMYSGLLILAFVIFHILHFTTGTIQLGKFTYGKVFDNLQSSFSLWPVAAGYILMMLVIGFHLFHGVWSLFQTLGLDNPDRNKFLRGLAIVSTVAISLGFAAVPAAFILGVIPNPLEMAQEIINK